MIAIARILAIALALAAGPLDAGVSFDGTSNGTAVGSTTEITGPPATICAWFQDTTTASAHAIVTVTDSAAGFTGLLQLVTQSPGKIAAGTYNGTTYDQALTTTTFTTNTWASACGVWTSATSRAAFLNGGGKGTNTTSITPSSIDILSVGYRASNTPALHLSGIIAEVGIWNVALSDDEVAMLGGLGGGGGMAPPCIRRDALVGYYPMIIKGSTGPDLFSSTINELTWGSGTASATHPRVLNCQ